MEMLRVQSEASLEAVSSPTLFQYTVNLLAGVRVSGHSPREQRSSGRPSPSDLNG